MIAISSITGGRRGAATAAVAMELLCYASDHNGPLYGLNIHESRPLYICIQHLDCQAYRIKNYSVPGYHIRHRTETLYCA